MYLLFEEYLIKNVNKLSDDGRFCILYNRFQHPYLISNVLIKKYYIV